MAGIAGGHPAEIDGSIKVRYVAPLLTQMSDREAGFLKLLGGIESFNFNNTKIEWVEDDLWSRRLSHGGLSDGNATALTVTGAAHRYPIGTILYNVQGNEYVRVTAHADGNTLTIVRDIIAAISEGAWASTDEVFVAGLSMHENDNYVFRPTSIFEMPFNVPQVFQSGVQASFRRLDTAIHGLTGSDLDKQAADLVAEMFVGMEMAAIHGTRFAGTSGVPAMFGGIKFYVTSVNGAQVTDLSDAPLTRKDIEDDFQNLAYTVAASKQANSIITSFWGKRKIDAFFAGAERLGPQSSGDGGVVVDTLNTAFGQIKVMAHTSLAQNELMAINTDSIQLGYHGPLGRPRLQMLPASTVGPRVQKAFYGDVSAIVRGVQGMARITGFSTNS